MTLRIGTLDRGHVGEAVALHRQAFPGFFLSQLGPAFLTQFYRGFLDDPTAVTVMARDETGRVIGTVVGTTHPHGFFGRLLRRRLPGFVAASVAAAAADPRRVRRLMRAVSYRGEVGSAPRGALLSSICVTPYAQGSGVGRQILAAWETAARDAGAEAATLTTDAADNDAVNDFYTRNGWTLDGSFSTPEGRRMNRYTKELA